MANCSPSLDAGLMDAPWPRVERAPRQPRETQMSWNIAAPVIGAMSIGLWAVLWETIAHLL